MSRLVINKNFQKKYLSTAYKTLVAPDVPMHIYGYEHPNAGYRGYFYFAYTNVHEFLDRLDYIHNSSYIEYNNYSSPNAYYRLLDAFNGSYWYGITGSAVRQDTGLPSNLFLVNESVLKVIDKINIKLREGLDTLPKVTDYYANYSISSLSEEDQNIFMSKEINPYWLGQTFLSNDKSIRHSAFQAFAYIGVITEEEADLMNNMFIRIKKYSSVEDRSTLLFGESFMRSDEYNLEYNAESNTIDYELQSTESVYKVCVENEYDNLVNNGYVQSVNNPLNEQLYIIDFAYNDHKFDRTNHDFGTTDYYYVYNNSISSTTRLVYSHGGSAVVDLYSAAYLKTPIRKFYNEQNGKVVPQLSYIALSVSETGQGADIEFDKIDEIEYIDNLKFRFRIPKEY